MDLWSQSGFLVQHWKAMTWATETELYAGDGARALEILDRDERALKRSFLLHVQYLRGVTAFVRGRSLIASIEATPARRADRVAKARKLARQLSREKMPWTAAQSSLVSAAAANAAGDRPGAIAALESAIHRANLADMAVYGLVARHRLGLLLGGAEERGAFATPKRR